MSLRDRAAIAGIGYTEFSRASGVSTAALAQRAISAALDDAGLSIDDVDGIASFSCADSIPPNLLVPMLGMHDVAWYLHQFGGGSASHTIVAEAAMAVSGGLADVVVCYRALNSRSGQRMGTSPVALMEPEMGYFAPSGYISAVQQFAMATRAHMHKYGTTAEQLGAIAVNNRSNAVLNERAMMRKPITIDDYLASRWISEPLRLLDCCLETDGAFAVVVTSAARARDLARPPVLISGATWGPGHTRMSNGWPDLTESGAKHSVPRLYSMAGVGPQDIDVAAIYDASTYALLVQVEDYGFCAKGEGGPFVASGAIARTGSMPLNTHGGLLSEGYIHGFNNIGEVVSQLRGDAGERQVPGASVGLSTGEGGMLSGQTSALILRADQ
jgi:acetyl-CoA acetyltransferase